MSRANVRERRVLDEAGGVRAMTWVMGIMLFLTVLAAALGLATRGATTALASQLAGRLTVQIVDGDAGARDRAAARALTLMRGMSEVARATPVDRAELARLLRPWLGNDGADPELPVPAMIDVDLAAGADRSDAAAARVASEVARIGASVRVDRHAAWMSPVSRFMTLLSWLAAGLVAMMLAATTAVVALAARAGLETHRATIEVMHMLGSTDVQVARLFQRRIALDAAIGGAIGAGLALAVVAAVGMQAATLGSELIGSATLTIGDILVLLALPAGFVALATLAARRTVLAALRRTL